MSKCQNREYRLEVFPRAAVSASNIEASNEAALDRKTA